MLNVAGACNLVIANYNAVSLLLNTALTLPRSLLLLCDRLVKLTENKLIGSVSMVCSSYMDMSLSLKVLEYGDPIESVKEVLLCPLITALMPKDELDKYLADLDKLTNSASPDLSTPVNKMNAGINAAMGYVSGDMHKALETHVYMQINNLIAEIENLYYADLKDIGLPGESIMSLIGYLQMGYECISTSCSEMKSLVTDVADFITELKLSTVGGTLTFDPWKNYPTELHDACKETAYEVGEASTSIKSVNKDVPQPEPKDPYNVPVWA